MTITSRGGQDFGDSQADIPEYLRDYSQKGYRVGHFADAICVCGGRVFMLAVDDEEGVAVRTCLACRQEHAIGDSDEYMEGAELSECGCPCGADGLELTLGVALYAQSDDVRWIFIGARCPSCRMIGCYADWKNEFPGYKALLARV